MLLYRTALPLSYRTLNLAARTIRGHRRVIGSPWHCLDPAGLSDKGHADYSLSVLPPFKPSVSGSSGTHRDKVH